MTLTANTQPEAAQAAEALPGGLLICEALVAVGVKKVFGVPGDTGVVFYDALAMTPQLQHVLLNDERGAVFAADAYARLTNTVGVVEVSSGGGATFCIGGLGEALAASVPLLVLSSDIHIGSRGSGALTEMDQVALYSGATKKQYLVEKPEDIQPTIEEALLEARIGRPGPVAIVIPENVYDEKALPKKMVASLQIPAERLEAPDSLVAQVAEALNGAEKPALLVGGGVHLSGAHAELQDVVEAGRVPVATTIHGKGSISETHEFSLGVLGGNGGRDYATQYLKEADVVVMVGTRANATDTDSHSAPAIQGPTIFHIDIESPSRAAHNYPDGTAVQADAKTVLAQLAPHLSPGEGRQGLAGWAKEQRDAWFAAAESRQAPEGMLDPLGVLLAVQECLPEKAVAVADCGTATPYLAAYWDGGEAGRSLVTPRGHGPMGYAIPGGIGAAVAQPEVPTVVITTDGSLLMAAGGLESSARMQLPIIYIQLTNGSLGWIKALQEFYQDGRYYSTQLSKYDGSLVAEGFGHPAKRVQTLEELKAEVTAALSEGRSTYIDVPIPDEHELLPPVSSWQRVATGEDKVRPVY